MIYFIKKYYQEIIGGIFCLTLGMLSGYAVKASNSLWYMSLNKPNFSPPNFLFALVWSLLYIMIGVALGKIWRNRDKEKLLLKMFIVQFMFNLLWSPLFFYYQRIDLALIDICMLWLGILILLFLS